MEETAPKLAIERWLFLFPAVATTYINRVTVQVKLAGNQWDPHTPCGFASNPKQQPIFRPGHV